MSVELFFSNPECRRKARDGPVADDIDAFAVWLAAESYAPSTARPKLHLAADVSVCSRLKSWLSMISTTIRSWHSMPFASRNSDNSAMRRPAASCWTCCEPPGGSQPYIPVEIAATRLSGSHRPTSASCWTSAVSSRARHRVTCPRSAASSASASADRPSRSRACPRRVRISSSCVRRNASAVPEPSGSPRSYAASCAICTSVAPSPPTSLERFHRSGTGVWRACRKHSSRKRSGRSSPAVTATPCPDGVTTPSSCCWLGWGCAAGKCQSSLWTISTGTR